MNRVWLRGGFHGWHRLLRLVTARGLFKVRVCGLCGALIVADAALQHDAVHRADVRRADRPGGP